MPSAVNQDELRKKLTCIFCEIILPGRVMKAAFPNENAKISDVALKHALESTRSRVTEIIEKMPVLNTQTLQITIPGEAFLELMLRSEYLYYKALHGEKETLKYANKKKEPEHNTLENILNFFGFFLPAHLSPHREAIGSYIESHERNPYDADAAYELMREILENPTHKELRP